MSWSAFHGVVNGGQGMHSYDWVAAGTLCVVALFYQGQEVGVERVALLAGSGTEVFLQNALHPVKQLIVCVWSCTWNNVDHQRRAEAGTWSQLAVGKAPVLKRHGDLCHRVM